MATSGPLSWLRQPEYTGENRCVPCTATNVVIAVVVSAAVGYGWSVAVGSLWWAAGGVVLVASLASIWLRGYLVPGTPELTERYFPDWLLAKFDKEPPAVAEDGPAGAGETGGPATGTAGSAGTEDGDVPRFVDPEEVLLGAGVVEPCEDVEDICLTDGFESAWLAEARDLRGDGRDWQVLVRAVFGWDEHVDLGRDEHGRAVARTDAEQLGAWVTDGALTADLAAARILRGRVDEWATIPIPQQLGILKALRSFLSTCPVCEGFVSATEDTVESCCRSWDVVAIRCTDCDTHLLELDPTRFGTAASDERPGATEGGFTR